MTTVEKYLHASHKSRQHIDAIFIDLRIEDIFLKYSSNPKSLDLFGKEINKSAVCAFYVSVKVKIPAWLFNIPLVPKVLSPVVLGNDDGFIFWLKNDRTLRNSLVCIDFLQLTSRCSQIIYRQQASSREDSSIRCTILNVGRYVEKLTGGSNDYEVLQHEKNSDEI